MSCPAHLHAHCCQVTRGQPSLSLSLYLDAFNRFRAFLRYFITWSCQKRSQRDSCVCTQSPSAAAHMRRNELAAQAFHQADVSRPSPPKHSRQHCFYVPPGSEREPRELCVSCMSIRCVCDSRGDCFYTERSREIAENNKQDVYRTAAFFRFWESVTDRWRRL